MFSSVNMFLARLRLIFAGAAGSYRTEMSSEKGQNLFTAKNINSITIKIIGEGIRKRNQRQYSEKRKMLNRQKENFFFLNRYIAGLRTA